MEADDGYEEDPDAVVTIGDVHPSVASNDPDAVNCYTEDGYTEEGVAAMKSLMMRANSGP
jgi:hypothetical protein